MMRLKQAIKLLHALVSAINKTTCGQDKIISQIKDWYAMITDIWNKQPCAWLDGKYFILLNKSKKLKEVKFVLEMYYDLLHMLRK